MAVAQEEPIEVLVEEVHPEPEPTALELVESFSEKYEVNPRLAKAIIKCESGVYSTSTEDIREYQRTIKNMSGLSTASGYAQFIDGTWYWTMERMGLSRNTDKHDPIISIQAFVWLLAQDGTSHWKESEHCWSKLL